jgi:16S rRNA (cytidine1402-2'-O)-methyltransferase
VTDEKRIAGDPAGTGGVLYVVATPIGNLRDVTLRALEVLAAVPLIAAEDTRIARRLLARYDIRTRTTSYHARSGAGRRDDLLERLRAGSDIALVTDAGTPGVSDPGEELVAAWAAEGGRVVPIPGPSAVLAAVSATGIAGPRWSFEGFLPRGGRERRSRLARIAADERSTVLFEAPNRLPKTLADLAAACGGERPAAVCRELTKIHEQIVRGSLESLGRAAHDGAIASLGEAVIVVGELEPLEAAASPPGGPALEAALSAVEGLVAGGLSRSEAARRVATETGIQRRRLYRPPNTG